MYFSSLLLNIQPQWSFCFCLWYAQDFHCNNEWFKVFTLTTNLWRKESFLFSFYKRLTIKEKKKPNLYSHRYVLWMKTLHGGLPVCQTVKQLFYYYYLVFLTGERKKKATFSERNKLFISYKHKTGFCQILSAVGCEERGQWEMWQKMIKCCLLQK